MIGWYMFVHTGLCLKRKVEGQCTVCKCKISELLSVAGRVQSKDERKCGPLPLRCFPFMSHCFINCIYFGKKIVIPNLEFSYRKNHERCEIC